jgi:hypothetical protein
MTFPFTLPNKETIRERNALSRYWDLDLVGHLVVQGPPGSGKTTAAIRRSIECKNHNRPSIFLVYHKLLAKSVGNLGYGMNISDKVDSIHHWWARRVLKNPSDQANWLNFNHNADWYFNHLRNAYDCGRIPREMIFDEAQDLPFALYEGFAQLAKYVLQKSAPPIRFAVFGDGNQQVINQANGNSLEEIAGVLGTNVQYLESNWRNPLQVWLFARQFQPKTRGDIWGENIVNRIEYEKRYCDLPQVRIYADDEERDADLLNKVRNSKGNVAVIMMRAESVRRYFNLLDGRVEVPISFYYNDNPVPEVMRDGGVLITTYQSMKGLEAEHIIIPDFPDGYANNFINQIIINTWFVACTRAKTGLTLYCRTMEDGTLPPPLCNFAPETFEQRRIGNSGRALQNNDDDIPF